MPRDPRSTLDPRGPSGANSARGASTPRGEAKTAWVTPRDVKNGASGGGDSLKMAGLGLVRSAGYKVGVDPAPDVAASGRPWPPEVQATILARAGLRPEVIGPTPRTPEDLGDIRRRHRRRAGPGEITVHWGLKDTAFPHPGEGYGTKSAKGTEDVAENFRSGQQFGVAEYLSSRGEAIYQSTTREPLGKSYRRGHELPADTKSPGFPGFGRPDPRDVTAKECIFPRGQQPDSEEAKAMYKRTHGSFAAGEMHNRGYAWPQAITEDGRFRFGVEDRPPQDGRGAGVKSALTMDCGDEPNSVPTTQLVKDTLEQYRLTSHDHLATSRSQRQGIPPQVLQGQAFGLPSGSDISAGELIRGFYPPEEQLPDRDLGQCLTHGRRNVLTQGKFGVPSIRLDRAAPTHETRSVACATDYGDEPNADTLIFPNKFYFLGVRDEDFAHRRSMEELQGIFEGAGYKSEDFQAIFENAARLHGDNIGLASVEALMYAYTESAAGA